MGGFSDLVDAAFSFPALIYTISTLLLMGFWVATTAIGAGLGGLGDLDLDLETDVDLDVDVDSSVDTDIDGSSNTLQTAMKFLGLTGMPVLLGLNLVSLFAWAVTMIVVVLLDGTSILTGGSGAIISIALLLAALIIGSSVTRTIGRTMWSKVRPAKATGRQDLIGKICRVTTQRVDGKFGQAEVRDRTGSSYLVQVRCLEPNALSKGDSALIFNFDDDSEAFTISPDVELTSGNNL